MQPTQGSEPPAWHGAPRRVGREAVAPGEQEGTGGFAVPRGKALRGAGTAAELRTCTFQHCQHGVTALQLRGQHEAPHFIKPCAMSETGDAIFPLLHSFLWCFSSHNLLACPYPSWNTNLTNVQSDCCDANKSITSSGVKFHS